MPNKKNKKTEAVKKLVIARLETFPPGKKISIGAKGEFAKDELIESVEKENEVGDIITKVELEYLQSLKRGIFYEQEHAGHQAQA